MTHAKIRWFDAITGTGMARLDDTQQSVVIHFTQFYTPSNRNFHFPSEYMQERLGEILTPGTKLTISENNKICLAFD